MRSKQQLRVCVCVPCTCYITIWLEYELHRYVMNVNIARVYTFAYIDDIEMKKKVEKLIQSIRDLRFFVLKTVAVISHFTQIQTIWLLTNSSLRINVLWWMDRRWASISALIRAHFQFHFKYFCCLNSSGIDAPVVLDCIITYKPYALLFFTRVLRKFCQFNIEINYVWISFELCLNSRIVCHQMATHIDSKRHNNL